MTLWKSGRGLVVACRSPKIHISSLLQSCILFAYILLLRLVALFALILLLIRWFEDWRVRSVLVIIAVATDTYRWIAHQSIVETYTVALSAEVSPAVAASPWMVLLQELNLFLPPLDSFGPVIVLAVLARAEFWIALDTILETDAVLLPTSTVLTSTPLSLASLLLLILSLL